MSEIDGRHPSQPGSLVHGPSTQRSTLHVDMSSTSVSLDLIHTWMRRRDGHAISSVSSMPAVAYYTLVEGSTRNSWSCKLAWNRGTFRHPEERDVVSFVLLESIKNGVWNTRSFGFAPYFLCFHLFQQLNMYRRRKPIVEEKPPIPDNLEEFGYVLKENGEIRSITQGSCSVCVLYNGSKHENLTHFWMQTCLMSLIIYPRIGLTTKSVTTSLSVNSPTSWWKCTYISLCCELDIIGDVVEDRLQKAPYNFQKVIVPIGADPAKDIHSYIYMTWVKKRCLLLYLS